MPDSLLGARPGWLCVDCFDPDRLARWWQQLIGGEISADDDGDVRLHVQPIPVLFVKVDEPKPTKNRLHLDLDVTDYVGAVEGALAMGATPADEIYQGERWRVLRDPEGNEFCIIRPASI
jgi:hypothetical protein